MKKLLSSTSKRISNHKLGNLPIWDLSDLYDGKHSDLLIMERKEICLRAKKFEKDYNVTDSKILEYCFQKAFPLAFDDENEEPKDV